MVYHSLENLEDLKRKHAEAHYNILDSQILLDLHRQAHRTKTEQRTTAEQLHSTGVSQLNHRRVQDGDHSMWGDHDKQAQETCGIIHIQSTYQSQYLYN